MNFLGKIVKKGLQNIIFKQKNMFFVLYKQE